MTLVDQPGDVTAPPGELVGNVASATVRLAVRLEIEPTTCTLVLEGVLAATTIAALEAQIDQLGCLRCDHLVIKVSGLTDVDAVGLNVLTGLRYYAGGRGAALSLVGANPRLAAELRELAGGGRP